MNHEGFEICGGILQSYTGAETTIEIPNGVRIIAKGAFDGVIIDELKFPDSLEEIEPYAFINLNQYSRLYSLRFPKDLKYLGEGNFCHLPKLNNISFEGPAHLCGSGGFAEIADHPSFFFPSRESFLEMFAETNLEELENYDVSLYGNGEISSVNFTRRETHLLSADTMEKLKLDTINFFSGEDSKGYSFEDFVQELGPRHYVAYLVAKPLFKERLLECAKERIDFVPGFVARVEASKIEERKANLCSNWRRRDNYLAKKRCPDCRIRLSFVGFGYLCQDCRRFYSFMDIHKARQQFDHEPFDEYPKSIR